MNTKSKKIIIIGVCLTFLLSVCLSVFMFVKTDATPQTLFAENYILGDTLQIPEHKLNVDGTDIQTEFYVENPEGRISGESTQILNTAGEWRVVYYGKHDGKTITKEERFKVQIPLATFTTEQDTAEYKGAPLNENVEGLVATLSSGSELTLNSIIDLRKVSGMTDFITFYVMPQKLGQYDCEVITVILEDVYDEDNFIEITIRESVEVPEGVPDDSHAFIKARASTQKYAFGYEKGHKLGKPNGGSNVGDQAYGFYANSSFAGYNFGLENCSFKLGYDYVTKTLYGWNNGHSTGGNHIIDFNDDNFTQSWKGFSSDYVRVKISADRFKSLSANVVITSLKGVALHSPIVDTSALTEINVDYGVFDEETYPNAIKGKPYKIFDAKSNSIYTKESMIVNVYTGYGSSTMTSVPITDGCFTPTEVCTHTIVYTVIDAFGNQTSLSLPVEVNATANEIKFDVDNTPITVNAGDYFDMPEISNVSGFVGEYYQYAKVVFDDGQEFDVSGLNKVKGNMVGNAKLVITIKDYVLNEKTVEIPLTVQAVSAPVIADNINVPTKYIVGGKYSVPSLIAEDYTSGKAEIIDCSVKIYADNTDNEIIPQAGYFTASGQLIKFVFEAVDKSGVKTQKEFNVHTVDVQVESSIDKSKYFEVENGAVAENKNYVLFTANNTPSAMATFVNQLYGPAFSFEFFVGNPELEGKDSLESVTVQLEEVDTAKKVTFTIGKIFDADVAVASISVNGGKAVANVDGYAFAERNIGLEIDGTKLKLSNTTINIENYLDGSEFGGFNGNVIVSVILNNVVDAEVRLIEIFGQILMIQPKDITKPMIEFDGENLREARLNQVVDICKATAFDVLNPYTEITLTVTSPDGKIMTSLDGVKLENVSSDRVYSVKFEQYGQYMTKYVARDGAGNNRIVASYIKCIDTDLPKISLESNLITVNVGSQVAVPKYEVSDNCSDAKNIIVLVQVFNYEGVMSTVVDGKFTPDKAGQWKIRIVAIDESFNMAYSEIICVVR